MNKLTKNKYELSKMYEYVNEIISICDRYQNDYETMAEDSLSYNATLMLIVQLGERAIHIRENDITFFKECPMHLRDVINMRNRVTHGYSKVKKELYIDAIKNDIPFFKSYIEENVVQEVLDDPYCLYEEEYEDVLERLEKEEELEMY